MASRNGKEKILYEQFKQEAKIVTMKSNDKSKKFIKWRNQIFQTSSLQQVFDNTAKHQMMQNETK
jgi:hypothetical protein